MRNFEKLGFSISVVLDEGRPTLRNSLMKLNAGCLFFLRFFLPRLTGGLLADVVHRKGVIAGGLDGWGLEGVQGVGSFLV